jgi:hypothetical protein
LQVRGATGTRRALTPLRRHRARSHPRSAAHAPDRSRPRACVRSGVPPPGPSAGGGGAAACAARRRLAARQGLGQARGQMATRARQRRDRRRRGRRRR